MMMNRPIDATLVSATLKRCALGERLYGDVTLRRRDGTEQRIGRVTVASRLGDVLTPGQAGRFFFHDVMGAQGLHAFAPVNGPTRIFFPMLVERTFALLALLNLCLVSGWLAYNGVLQILPLTLTVVATAAWAACRGCREAVLHDTRYEGRVAAASTHREAVLRKYA